ncbi:hypothetical protein PHYPSEUDO_002722 [Phytophthora pseudosyringae]|uniref:CDR ABC transporter domain-containing protein n=1 Tax=Phytophthora pseudosyringae TaxID=221518 RepID=A0A8T1WJ96_9STRA|nr:hypothetical protein PHYPSEUDO_002722 [Phytophthora pseudosyringae]
MVGLDGFADGVIYWINVALMILFQAYMGQLLAFALPNPSRLQVALRNFATALLVLGARGHRLRQVLQRAAPERHAGKRPPVTVGEIPVQTYVEVVFGIKHAHIAQYLGIMAGTIVFFRVLTALAMRYISHQQR